MQSHQVPKRHHHRAARCEKEHNEHDSLDGWKYVIGLQVDDSLAESDMDGEGYRYDQQLATFTVVVQYEVGAENL